MQPIKLAYEWIGPSGPISNNDFPNLYDLRRQYDRHTDYNYPVNLPSLKDSLSDIYDMDVVPVSNIKAGDFFLYEINIDYKLQFAFESFHISNTRIQHILNDDKSLGYYAFNSCLEGRCDGHFLQQLYELIRKKKINPSKVILFNGSINAQELHDEWVKRNRIATPINIVSCNNYYKIPKQRINNKKSRSKKFVCFNRRWKPHRLLLYVYLHKNNLLDHFYFSLPKTNISNDSDSFHRMTLELANKYAFDISADDVSSAFNDLPLVLDSEDFDEGLQWWEHSKLSQYHSDSYISIITETMFEEQEVFPTEKSYRAMSFAHPFITVGSAGFLNGLRSLGFKTFDAIDESYDLISNNADRLRTLLNMIHDMCDWPESKFEELITNTQAACLHNYHLLSTTTPKSITVNQMSNIYDNR